jgi:two-component system, chemotaxis family, protein-glutamate methylesterase/glutaminase
VPAHQAEQGEALTPGRIYVAPPDHHMLVKDGAVRLSRGPRVNWTRPAIDPLFQSVAEAFGARAIGVVLTGNLNDGTLGLYEIRRRGGRAVVQDPMEAESPGVPTSALAQAGADHCVALAGMPALLCRLAAEVAGVEAYRCHIGHVLTIETLLHAKHRVLEERLGACLAVLNERAELCRLMGAAAKREGREASWFEASRAQSLEQAEVVRRLLESDWSTPKRGAAEASEGGKPPAPLTFRKRQ